MSDYLKNLKIEKDVIDAINKIKKLQAQRINPDRNGMISALRDAKITALKEILDLECKQGDENWKLFGDVTDNELYCKLEQYQKGLENYCIERIGKQLYNELMSRKSEV
jgi:hypothetical protein